MTPDKQEALDWLAFQYISNELPDQEAADFESQLAGDQDAREAVARAVELTNTLAAVSAVEEFRSTKSRPVAATLRKQTDRWKRVALFAVATSACLAFILWRHVFHSSPRAGDEAPVARQADVSAELASVWMETHDEIESATGQLFEDLDEPDDDFVLDDESESDVETPDWMLVAVAAMHKETDE